MSWQGTSWAGDQVAGGAGPKLLLLTLANEANSAGICIKGRKTLAELCECRPETVSANMAKLEEAGLIARLQRRRANGSRTSDYIVLAPGRSDRGAMVDADPEDWPVSIVEIARSGEKSQPRSGEDFAPKGGGQVRKTGRPEDSKPLTVSSSQGASARGARLAYRGKAVAAEVVEKADAALTAFNEVNERRIGARAADGSLSAAAKQVVGAMLDRPDVSIERWVAAIKATKANPPSWHQGDIQIGTVFGERAAEHALANRGPVDPLADMDESTRRNYEQRAKRLEEMSQ